MDGGGASGVAGSGDKATKVEPQQQLGGGTASRESKAIPPP